MNKLRQNLFTRKSWGTEVIWSLTDNYMAKTIEIDAGKQSPLIVQEQKEKSIIVISGELYLTYGECCSEKEAIVYKLPEGWSWYIDPGKIHRYGALNESVRFVEISSPQLEDGIMIVDENGIEFKAVDVKNVEDEVKSVDKITEKKQTAVKKKPIRKPRKKLKEKEPKNDRNKRY
jgi:quercetin dioxygenase-like cupin family protein